MEKDARTVQAEKRKENQKFRNLSGPKGKFPKEGRILFALDLYDKLQFFK